LTLLIIDLRVPAMESIGSTPELWNALRHLGPSLFAFLLSFVIVLITWVNHHGTLGLVRGSSSPFYYANGFLLLTVVFIPFPTALLGSYLWTDHASPAVVVYNGVLAAQAVGWMLVTSAAIGAHLTESEAATLRMRVNRKHAYFAFALYGLL